MPTLREPGHEFDGRLRPGQLASGRSEQVVRRVTLLAVHRSSKESAKTCWSKTLCHTIGPSLIRTKTLHHCEAIRRQGCRQLARRDARKTGLSHRLITRSGLWSALETAKEESAARPPEKRRNHSRRGKLSDTLLRHDSSEPGADFETVSPGLLSNSISPP